MEKLEEQKVLEENKIMEKLKSECTNSSGAERIEALKKMSEALSKKKQEGQEE